MSALQKLKDKCEEWGGALVVVHPLTYYKLFRAGQDDNPFTEAPATQWHGCHFGEKIVYAMRGQERMNGIIHEMGHVFASRVDPNDWPDEFDWLGWEIVLAIEVGCYREWSTQNNTYGVDHASGNSDWGELTAKQKAICARERVKKAIKLGLIVDGRARAIR